MLIRLFSFSITTVISAATLLVAVDIVQSVTDMRENFYSPGPYMYMVHMTNFYQNDNLVVFLATRQQFAHSSINLRQL